MKQARWDIATLFVITLIGIGCYLLWPVLRPPAVLVSAGGITLALIFFSALVWNHVSLWLTKFFCVAAILDLAAEGVLAPYHGETIAAKLICQMTLFAVYALYLAALRPLDVWLASRR